MNSVQITTWYKLCLGKWENYKIFFFSSLSLGKVRRDLTNLRPINRKLTSSFLVYHLSIFPFLSSLSKTAKVRRAVKNLWVWPITGTLSSRFAQKWRHSVLEAQVSSLKGEEMALLRIKLYPEIFSGILKYYMGSSNVF